MFKLLGKYLSKVLAWLSAVLFFIVYAPLSLVAYLLDRDGFDETIDEVWHGVSKTLKLE